MTWPEKHQLLGVDVSATTYEESIEAALVAARQGHAAVIDHMPVHGLVEATRDDAVRTALNSFDIVAPDGQPIRWALNYFSGTDLHDRVYGPELMLRLCSRAADERVAVYLYGSGPRTIARLEANLLRLNPGLSIAGAEAPPFRCLTTIEDREVVSRINGSGAKIVFLGLGCPKQEVFAHEHRYSINAVQVCVGAAFDFLSGEKKMAPKWMQDRGLEWLFRLLSEPRRLHRRYFRTNTFFLFLLLREFIRGRRRCGAAGHQ